MDQYLHLSLLLVRASVPSGWLQQGDETLEEQEELPMENQREKMQE